MTPELLQVAIQEFSKDLGLAWYQMSKAIDEKPEEPQKAIDLFLDRWFRCMSQAGFREADFLDEGVFDPPLDADLYERTRSEMWRFIFEDISATVPGYSCGLSTDQYRALQTFERSLNLDLSLAVDYGTLSAYTPREIPLQVKRLENQMLLTRCGIIGLSESVRAINLGVLCAVNQTQETSHSSIKTGWFQHTSETRVMTTEKNHV